MQPDLTAARDAVQKLTLMARAGELPLIAHNWISDARNALGMADDRGAPQTDSATTKTVVMLEYDLDGGLRPWESLEQAIARAFAVDPQTVNLEDSPNVRVGQLRGALPMAAWDWLSNREAGIWDSLYPFHPCPPFALSVVY